MLLGVAFSFALTVAVASYALLYWLMIPPHTHQSDVFFDYQARGPVYDIPSKGRRVSRNRLAWSSPRSSSSGGGGGGGSDNSGSGVSGGARQWGPVATVDFFAQHSQWSDFKRGSVDGPSAAEACSELHLSGTDADVAADLYAGLYAAATVPLPPRSSSYETIFEAAEAASTLSPYAPHSASASFFLDEYSAVAAGCGDREDCPLMESVPGPRTSAPQPKRSVLTRDVEYSIALDLVLPVRFRCLPAVFAQAVVLSLLLPRQFQLRRSSRTRTFFLRTNQPTNQPLILI